VGKNYIKGLCPIPKKKVCVLDEYKVEMQLQCNSENDREEDLLTSLRFFMQEWNQLW